MTDSSVYNQSIELEPRLNQLFPAANWFRVKCMIAVKCDPGLWPQLSLIWDWEYLEYWFLGRNGRPMTYIPLSKTLEQMSKDEVDAKLKEFFDGQELTS